jgi:hypothetical protein
MNESDEGPEVLHLTHPQLLLLEDCSSYEEIVVEQYPVVHTCLQVIIFGGDYQSSDKLS